MPTVLISSINYSGQVSDITFYPQTGGTVNLGSQLIPYYYTADYVYGFYSLFFSAFNSTCTYEILSPTPTPTQTMTMTPTPTRFPLCVDCEMSGVSFSTICYGCFPIAFGIDTKVNATSYSVVMTFDGGVNYNYTTTFAPYSKFTNITRGYLGSTSVYFFIADFTDVFYSENGYDWANAGPVFSGEPVFTAFGQDNNDNFIWLVYSNDPLTTTSIFYSTNLTTWTQATISNPQTDGWCDFAGVRENSSIAYGWDNSSNRLWVQVARSGGSFDQAISYDGYNWSGINTSINCNFVSFGDGVWVKAETGNLTKPFYYSYDGINWTLMSTTFASGKAVQCLNFGNNRFVAAVRTQFTNVLEIYYSDNGITWTLGSLYPSTVTGSLSQVQYDSQNNRWYVVGNTSVSFAFYSTDNGVTWSASSPNDALNSSQFDVDACEVLIPTPAPTRSVTPTRVTPTPTPTRSPELTQSPTNTPSQSITPSITSSVTPTITLSPTRSVTPTSTVTPTRVTPTPTRTITPTRTLTPTVTPTDYPCNCFAFTNSGPSAVADATIYDCRQRLSIINVTTGRTEYACGFIVSLQTGVSSIAYSAQCASQSSAGIPPGCCLCYQLTFTAGTAPYSFATGAEYLNCNGQLTVFTASTVGPHYICANSQDKVIELATQGAFTGASFSILSGCDSGNCLGLTPTPTPTQTQTKTPTPTPTPTSGTTSLCNCITLANTGGTEDTYSYISCSGGTPITNSSFTRGFINSFCAQSFTANTSGSTQIVTGSACSVDGDCSNCVCITFTNNTGDQGTYGYRDCAGDTRGPFTIEDGESIQVCGFRVVTGSLSKNILWSIGGVCEDGVTCPIELTSESILLWDDSNQLVYLYDHPNNTITDIGLVDIMGGSLDIARNQSHIWMYEPIDSENTTFRQWDITSTNPFSAPTYTDYSITAGTDNGLTVYNSTDTVFAMSSDTESILRITMSTGNVVKANDFSGVSVSDFIYNPSDNLLIIAGQDTITGNYGIFQYDGGGLTSYHNNGVTDINALYQYGSQLFYIDGNFDVYQIDLTSPYTTTYIQTISGLGRLRGAAQDDPNVITVKFI